MNINYVIIETHRPTGELRIGFHTPDKIVLMADFLIFGTGKRQTKVANRFYSMSIAKKTIKRLEKHYQQMEELI